MKDSPRYEIMGLGDEPYTYREVAQLTADCIIGAVNRIRPEGGTEWKMLRDTEFGTMLPKLNARWELEESIIKRRFPWYFNTLMALAALALLSFGWSTILAAAEIDADELPFLYHQIPGYLALVLIPFHLFFFLSLLYHFWQLIPAQLNRIPPGIRVALMLVPFFGAIWNFFAFHGLSLKLREVHFKSGIRREKDCCTIALLGCIGYALLFLGGFFYAPLLLTILTGCAVFFSMSCMKDQALDILNKRLRINFDTGMTTVNTPVATGLKKYIYPRKSYWAWGVLAAAILTWALPALFYAGLFYMARTFQTESRIVESTLTDAERAEFDAALDRLESAINQADPDNKTGLFPPATEEELQELRNALGGRKVETLERFLRRFNGSARNILPEGNLIPARQMALEYLSLRSALHFYLPSIRRNSVRLIDDGAGDGFLVLLTTPVPMVYYDMLEDSDDNPETMTMLEFVNFLADGIEQKVWIPGERPGNFDAYLEFQTKYRKKNAVELPPKSPLELIRRHM